MHSEVNFKSTEAWPSQGNNAYPPTELCKPRQDGHVAGRWWKRLCHRWGDGRWPAWWWVRARALETEVPVFKSCSLLLAVLLCADYLTSLGSSSLLLCYMGVIMPKTVMRIGWDNICKVYSIPCLANGKLESSQLLLLLFSFLPKILWPAPPGILGSNPSWASHIPKTLVSGQGRAGRVLCTAQQAAFPTTVAWSAEVGCFLGLSLTHFRSLIYFPFLLPPSLIAKQLPSPAHPQIFPNNHWSNLCLHDFALSTMS